MTLLSRFFRTFGCLWLLALTVSATQLPEITVPQGGSSLIHPAQFHARGEPQTYAATSRGPTENPTWEIATLRDTSPAWAIQLSTPSTRPVERDDVALVRFRGRLLHTLQESGQGKVRLVVQETGGNYERSGIRALDLTREWQEFFVPVRFPKSYAPGEVGLYFEFGYAAQTVEIGDISLMHYGKQVAYGDLPRTRVTYAGAEPDARWRQDALARIEQIRKGELAVTVTDTAGRPIPGATVRIQMQRHHFEFGTAVQLKLLLEDSPDADRYRDVLLSLFNAVGPENDLKWPAWSKSSENREKTVQALHWLRSQGLPVRGHVLAWPGRRYLPKDIVALFGTERQNEIPALLRAHIRDVITATQGLLTEWDVLNEPYSNRDLMDLFGPEIMAEWFKIARALLGPSVPLYFNDWGNHDLYGDPNHFRHFIDTARYILAQGGPIDGLGLQCHIGGIPTAPETLLKTLDAYQKELGLPIRATEFDFTTDDPSLHAQYTRDFLIAYFSHPSVVGIQYWGFWEKAHWKPVASLYNADWSERPAGTATRQMIREVWWTHAEGRTDDAGRYSVRGFYGTYTIVATHNESRSERTLSHLPGNSPTSITLSLP